MFDALKSGLSRLFRIALDAVSSTLAFREPATDNPQGSRRMVTPLDVAARYVGQTETTRNRSEVIRTFWPDTNYPEGYDNREPYCAAFVCHCLALASREGWQHEATALPQEAAVRNLQTWAKGRKGVKVFNSSQATPMPGDIAIYLPKLSHTGFVESFDKSAGKIHTIEANTNSEGGRDGDGIFRKTRSASFAGSFIRFL